MVQGCRGDAGCRGGLAPIERRGHLGSIGSVLYRGMEKKMHVVTPERSETLRLLQQLRDDLAPLYPKSRAHAAWAESVIPGARARARFAFPFPIWFERGQGSRLWDLDGREYIDGVGGHGP